MRSFTVIDAEQRSESWFAARCGRLTASCAKDMLATIAKGEAAVRRDLRVRLVVERLTGLPQDDGFVNADMQRGTDLESAAFGAYEAQTGQMAQRVGFLAHTALMAGCSPDGVIGDYEGILELKVPRSATHLRYLRAGTLPAEHVAQVTHHLWISGAAFVDFVSWDPRFPEPLQLFRVRVPMDEAQIAAYEIMVRAFLADVDREVEAVRAMLPAAEAVS